MRFLLELIGIAGDVQSAVDIVDTLKENARGYWVSSFGVLTLFILLLVIIRARIYWKMWRKFFKEGKKQRVRDFNFSELVKLHDEKFRESSLSVYRIMLRVLLGGLAFVSLVAGIIQLIIYFKFS